MKTLDWPYEGARESGFMRFVQTQSNICLDLHGDPRRAGLAVFSDGNHHMALQEALADFLAGHPAAADVFYATTPPRVILEALETGGIRLGNLLVSVLPHVFISPPPVLARLAAAGHVTEHRPFARNLGSALLVAKGNPRDIRGVEDLARGDIRVFLSNPVTESVSYEAYAQTLRAVAARRGIVLDFLDLDACSPRVVYGESIHHREAPQSVADGSADVAVVYHHLALRYVRIFPLYFEMVVLGEGAGRDPDHVTNALHAGVIGDGGKWGGRLMKYLSGERGAAVYARHGFTRA